MTDALLTLAVGLGLLTVGSLLPKSKRKDKPMKWRCANCDHATGNRDRAAQHLTKCLGAGEYPTELDPKPWIMREQPGTPRFGVQHSDRWGTTRFKPRPGYVQDRNAYDA